MQRTRILPFAEVCRDVTRPSILTLCRESSPFAGTRHLLESLEERWTDANMRTGMETGQAADTLVIYVYSNSDSEYERNLHFFVERGIADGDGSHYIIVVQEVGALLKSNPGLRGFATGDPEDEFCRSHAGPAFGGEL